jgi:imidazolonepropionase-like amidohydrolase
VLLRLGGASVSGQPAEEPVATLALVGGAILADPTAVPLADGVVLVGDGRILAVGRREDVPVPPGAETIDARGLTITAGFQNSHVHFFERKWADAAEIPPDELALQLREDFTRYGFTGVFDTGSAWRNTRAIRDRIEAGEVPGPRIRSTGEALVAPGAVPPDRVLAVLGFAPFSAPEIASPSEAAAATRRLLDLGVDGVKVHLQPPPPPARRISDAAMAEAVTLAHGAGRPVFVHPVDAHDVAAAVRAGADVVAHTTPGSGAWSGELLTAMRDADVAVTPTLSLWRAALRHDRVGVRQQAVEAAVGQLRDWVGVGGTVLFGTDVGAVDPDPEEEYRLMARAGMSGRQILASMTVAPAARFGESERRGRVAAGLAADLVALRGDPARDAGALARVAYTIRGGQVLYRAR